jgi:murein DD-endopeptidase MepM/ murein hydrolase activator NlpD
MFLIPFIGYNQIGKDSTALKLLNAQNLEQTISVLLSDTKGIKFIPAIFPFNQNFKVSSHFGYRIHPITGMSSDHQGVDYICPEGTPILSTANGRVLKIEYHHSIKGNAITISHLGNWNTFYGHLSRIIVQAGDLVEQGQIIGFSGNTGRSTGAHLHYSVSRKGEYFNPLMVSQISNQLLNEKIKTEL